KLVVVQPGDYRVKEELAKVADDAGLELEVREDTHFYDTIEAFANWASGRKSLVLETYYRHMRRKHNVLISEAGGP
ncbi:MAG: cryptochrome/photolyase family protein, partial [Akkermansiaceae bacterium]|nr:cryptochrome/photolyase family protein [Akkermansiaceae bacterium]